MALEEHFIKENVQFKHSGAWYGSVQNIFFILGGKM